MTLHRSRQSFSHYITTRTAAPDSQPGLPLQLTVLTQFFPPDFAATGQLIEELVQQLSQQGVDVNVFTGQPSYAFQDAEAPAFEQLGLLKVKRSRMSQLWPQRIRGKAINGILFLLRTVLFLIRHHRECGVLLITTAPPFLPIVGYFANLCFGVPYVCILYDLYPDIAVELGVLRSQHWLTRFWRKLNFGIWRRAQELVVLSPTMQQHIAEQCPEVAAKISVIHSWANPNWIVPIPKQENWFALRYQLIEPFTVLYSGNMGRCHDLDTVLSAAILLKDEPIKFVCIGDGAKRKRLLEQSQKLGLTNLVFLPYQDRAVLPYSLTACDLSLVSVSSGMENLLAPSKLYSALSAGRPVAVICPPQCYLNDLIQEAGCGVAIANGDGERLARFIRKLAADTTFAKQMGRAGRQYLKNHFTPEIVARQYLQALQQSIGSVKRSEAGRANIEPVFSGDIRHLADSSDQTETWMTADAETVAETVRFFK